MPLNVAQTSARAPAASYFNMALMIPVAPLLAVFHDQRFFCLPVAPAHLLYADAVRKSDPDRQVSRVEVWRRIVANLPAAHDRSVTAACSLGDFALSRVADRGPNSAESLSHAVHRFKKVTEFGHD